MGNKKQVIFKKYIYTGTLLSILIICDLGSVMVLVYFPNINYNGSKFHLFSPA